MSVTISIDIFCDKCSDWTHGCTSGTRLQARRSAKADGWWRIKLDGKLVDLCPRCGEAAQTKPFVIPPTNAELNSGWK